MHEHIKILEEANDSRLYMEGDMFQSHSSSNGNSKLVYVQVMESFGLRERRSRSWLRWRKLASNAVSVGNDSYRRRSQPHKF